MCARQAVQYAIKIGKLPKVSTLFCVPCFSNIRLEAAKQYHHHKGYAPEHQLDVIPVCIPCHNQLDE